MPGTLLETGDCLLAVHRRLFDRDDNRLFVGAVDAFESGVIRVTGYTFVRDAMAGECGMTTPDAEDRRFGLRTDGDAGQVNRPSTRAQHPVDLIELFGQAPPHGAPGDEGGVQLRGADGICVEQPGQQSEPDSSRLTRGSGANECPGRCTPQCC